MVNSDPILPLSSFEKTLNGIDGTKPTQTSSQAKRIDQEDGKILTKAAASATRDLAQQPSGLQRAISGDSVSSNKSPSTGREHETMATGAQEKSSQREEDEQDEEKRFEVQWEGDDDPTNPRCLSKRRKWMIVLLVSAGSTCVTCASSMYTLTYAQLSSDFHISRVIATLGLSLFVMGLGIGPMLLAPLSEFYGRRPIYVVSFTMFLVWLIPCAVAKNLGTELVARFIDGFAGSAFLSVAGGTVGDLFTRNELQAPMMVFTASPFIGPPIGPMIAGFINQYTDWYVILHLIGVQRLMGREGVGLSMY